MTSYLRRIKLCSAVALAALIGGLACDAVRPPTPIGDIVQEPQQFIGREVMVRGTVTSGVKLPLLPGLYWIDNGTGQIPVLTDRQAPFTATKLRVVGRVEYVGAVGAIPIGVHISETRRR